MLSHDIEIYYLVHPIGQELQGVTATNPPEGLALRSLYPESWGSRLVVMGREIPAFPQAIARPGLVPVIFRKLPEEMAVVALITPTHLNNRVFVPEELSIDHKIKPADEWESVHILQGKYPLTVNQPFFHQSGFQERSVTISAVNNQSYVSYGEPLTSIPWRQS